MSAAKAATSVNSAGLKLPMIAKDHRNNGRDAWKFQTYKDFAKKTEKLNSDVTFTKELMDDAFRAAVERIAAGKIGSSSTDKKDIARVCVSQGNRERSARLTCDSA